MVTLKSHAEIEKMRAAGQIVRETLDLLGEHVKPGVTTRHLDALAYEYITSHHAYPSFLHYEGYPASVCASVNEMVVHGIPGSRKLKEGDIISLDVGAVLDGYHGDAARTFAVGEISPENARLIEVTRECFFKAVEVMTEGHRLSDIAAAVQQHAESHGYSVVRALTGHGIGREMHEDPQVPNFVTSGLGMRLKNGMVLAVEPMINLGTWQVKFLDDGWGVVTRDGKNWAHYENTVAITENGPRILTL